MSSGRDSRRGSKANVAAAENSYRNSERKERAKSQQSFAQYTHTQHAAAAGPRRGSLKPATEHGQGNGSTSAGAPPAPPPKRPVMGTRTTSAPLVERRQDEVARGKPERASAGMRLPALPTGAPDFGQDEDEVAGVVGTMKQYEPFRSPPLEDALPQINIAVIGQESVGKSTFILHALDLDMLAASNVAERALPFGGLTYLVRLLEISIDDVDLDDDDDSVTWPSTIANKQMPHVDGVLTLYDVKDRSSLDDVHVTLTAFGKAALPSVLVACKCDTHPAERQIDPTGMELRAKQAIRGLHTMQTTLANPNSHKRALELMVKAIVRGEVEEEARSASANRLRAQSNAMRPVSPRPPTSHARASSEYAASLNKDKAPHSRHDSSLAGYGVGSDRLKPPGTKEEEIQRSFLLEESGTESSSSSARSSTEESSQVATPVTVPQPTSVLSEHGATFDELVDKLLAQPTSKTDTKFIIIFLALYRKFAAPGRLLEAIVERYDALGRNGQVEMTKVVAQLRILSVMDQWINHYPGDFAYQKTRRRMRTFIAKISATSIFNVAGKEMSAGLEAVQEDDDTNWAFTDKNRESGSSDRWTMSSTASTLIDDDSFIFPDNMSTFTANDDASVAPTTGGADTIRSASGSSTTSSQIMLNVESAQRQAQLLQPRPRLTLTKMEWRMLMEIPDDVIAKELTRMDWIMFSSIRPRDLVRHVSLKKEEQAKCKNLVNATRMIKHFNHLSAWAKNFILHRDKPKHRALMLEKMMRVARKLRELNNYNAVGAIIAGVRSSSIIRLQATRDLIPPPIGKDWSSLEILMNPNRNHAAYRTAWDNSASERIPYIPLHRRDLVSAEEGNKTFLDNGTGKEAKINWYKFEKLGDVIFSLQRAQGVSYRGLSSGRGGEHVRELVLDVKIVTDEEELYTRSQQLEATPGQGGSTSTRFKEFFRR